jgi:arylsulfatase A-like enzyme
VLTDPSKDFDYYFTPQNDSQRRALLETYAGQVRCAHLAVARIIEAIDSTVGPDRSIVIVQGDHGSRLAHPHDDNRALGKYSVDELNFDFPTLLAVRRPGVAAILHTEPTPVQDVLWSFARSGFAGTPPDSWQHYVALKRVGIDEKLEIRPLALTEMPWIRHPH